ncbi:MAG: SpoIIE family protein phosphatase [Bacteroidota bacterium]|nr:SpoIIE family protein phosphatase [Bacteroidota bacterium]
MAPLFLVSRNGIAQRLKPDSLWNVYHTSKVDSNRLSAIHNLAWQMTFTNPDSAITLAKMELELAIKTGTLRSQGHANNTNNPLWISKDNEAEMIEIKPDKQPVGYFETCKPFTTHTLSLEKGTVLYLVTDGYADQFGGVAGKKFKYRLLKELLITNKALSIPAQHKLLSDTFSQWKGNLEQVDDVCVIGIRI